MPDFNLDRFKKAQASDYATALTEIKNGRKMYRGMASKKAQISWRGGVPEGMAAEGESTMVACKGSVQDVLKEVTGGIRSGMTYLGVEHLQQIPGAAVFIEMSAAGLQESMPHGLALGDR